MMIPVQNGFDFRETRNAGDAAVLLRGEAGGGTGETDDLRQFVRSKVFGRFAAPKQPAHGAAAEDVPGACGINHMDSGRAGNRNPAGRGGRVAAFRPQGCEDKGYAVFRKQFPCACLRSKAPQPVDFLIADLDDVRLPEGPFDGSPGI